MIYVIVGASASGKTTFMPELIKLGCKRVITNTTRKRRVSEGEPKDAYHFLTVDEFKAKIASGLMLEHAVYGGNMYGTSADSVEDNSVVILEPNGYYALKKALPEGAMCGIYMKVSDDLRIERAGERASSVLGRLEQDRELFNTDLESSVDYVLENTALEDYASWAKEILSAKAQQQ